MTGGRGYSLTHWLTWARREKHSPSRFLAQPSLPVWRPMILSVCSGRQETDQPPPCQRFVLGLGDGGAPALQAPPWIWCSRDTQHRCPGQGRSRFSRARIAPSTQAAGACGEGRVAFQCTGRRMDGCLVSGGLGTLSLRKLRCSGPCADTSRSTRECCPGTWDGAAPLLVTRVECTLSCRL